MKRSKAAFLFSAEALAKTQSLYFWTFTFADVMDIKVTRKLWNHLLTLLKRSWPQLQGIRVFEMHKEHGLHVHLVTNRFIDVNQARALAQQAGWGRIHVKRMPKNKAGYLAKYLSKERPKCLKGWRLWAAFGKGWMWTRVADIEIQSLFSTIYRACKEWLHWKGNKGFFERTRLVNFLYIRTIEEDWKDGLGPDDKPYWMCSREELMQNHFQYDAPF